MSNHTEAEKRAAQEKISQYLNEASESLKSAQELADVYGLSFTFEATDGSDGSLDYYGEEGGSRYSPGGDWYSSNC